MPEVEVDTYVVSVTHEEYSSAAIAEALRRKEIPIIVRVHNEKVLLDFRTVDLDEIHTIVAAFR